ncbi:transporter [Chromobacterium violaceum]|uniref:Transporter n=1 Tax=Chromobacterium violaceum TaxID=536 RepID=A0A202B3N0_CHRVL|nr:TolC family protein [Chromobacterium violaceum]MBA8737201.1 TolC family protein [Chromobacterium violaceum]OVE46186.1 transporter [Chromobacterium violaceum]
MQSDFQTRPRSGGFRLAPLALALALTGCAVAPQPLSLADRQAQLAADRQIMFGSQEAVTAPVTLQEAMARALKYNLDYRVKLMEEAMAQRQLDLSSLDMLPKLALAAGYTARSKDNASSSQNVATGEQSLVPSISTEKRDRTADLNLSWNVLDFGVSYYAAQQQADRVLILEQRKRKVAQQLMQQVREAWWQAAGAQQLQGRVDALLKDAQSALEDARQVEKQKLRSPLDALNYRRQLLDVIRQMTAVRNALSQAKPRLAAIMNVSPGQDFQVATPSGMPVPTLGMDVEHMEEMALLNRPEVVEAQYSSRIGALETRKAIARLLPGLEFSVGQHYDSNKFLVNNSWSDAGLRISWNLLNLFSAGPITRAADAQKQVSDSQRLALSMAVLTQVHVAYLDFQGKARQYQLEHELSGVDQAIYQQTRNAVESGASARLQGILADANAVFSSLRLYQSYGDLQNAYGLMGASLGLDPMPATTKGYDLASLSQALKGAESQWQGTVSGGKP